MNSNKASFLGFIRQNAKNFGMWLTIIGGLVAILTWVGHQQDAQNQRIAQYAINQDKLNDVISEQAELKETVTQNQQFDLKLIFQDAEQRCRP